MLQPYSPNPVTQVHIHDYQSESVRNWCVNDTHQLSPDVTVHVFTVRAVVSLLYVLAQKLREQIAHFSTTRAALDRLHYFASIC